MCMDCLVCSPVLDCFDLVALASCILSTNSFRRLPKFDLPCFLQRVGFVAGHMGEGWGPGDDLVSNTAMLANGSKFYLLALPHRDDIIWRGAGQILHRGPAKYYEALVKLADLTEVGRMVAGHQFSAPALTKLLDDEGFLRVDEDGELTCTANNLAIEDGPLVVEVHAFGVVEEVGVTYNLPSHEGAQAIPGVLLDNCSHSSGVLRASTTCVWGHSLCFKHVQLNVAGSGNRAIAWCQA